MVPFTQDLLRKDAAVMASETCVGAFFLKLLTLLI